MSRQLDALAEERETARRLALVKALEYGLNQALENSGAELRGFAIKYQDHNCLLTLKADMNGRRFVAFVGSDTMMNCIIKADADAARASLSWTPDKYHNNQA